MEEENYPGVFISMNGNSFEEEAEIPPTTDIANTCEEVDEEVKVKNEVQEETNIDNSESEDFDANRMLKMEVKEELSDHDENFVHHAVKIEDIKLESDGSAFIQVKQEIENEFENEIK